MKFVEFVIFIINFVHLFHSCTTDSHSWGHQQQFLNYKMHERVLIDDRSDVLKNYTIIHKYFGSHNKEVACFEINVNAESNGYIHQSNGQAVPVSYDRPQTFQIFDAKVHINNAKNVTATLSIYGFGWSSIGTVGWLNPQQATKSLTYIYVKNALPRKNAKQLTQNSIGQRRQDDELIYFESRNVTNYNHFPSRSFEYSGSESFKYITYVGFSFNSPTSMVMINTSYVGEQDFNAVVYDMNTEHFVANMSVYGIKSFFRPPQFLGVK